MKTHKTLSPAILALVFATPLGCSIWVASNNLAVGIGLAAVVVGVYLSIVRKSWVK